MNYPNTADPASTLLFRPVRDALERSDQAVSIAPLYKGSLPDSSQIFLVRGADQRPIAVFHLSSEIAPNLVARAVERSQSAVTALGPELGARVLLPVGHGQVAGRSYAITPYARSFARSRWLWVFQRARAMPVVLDWLHDAAAATCRPAPAQDVAEQYSDALRRMAALVGCGDALKAAAARALERLDRDDWQPRQVLMHGDIWKGNFLLRTPSADAQRNGWADRIVLIDWAGSKTHGHPIFDLVRAAEAFRVSPARLRREILRHCEFLQCEPEDAHGYLLASAGTLLASIEHFPLPRFIEMAQVAFDILNAALAHGSSRRAAHVL